MVEQVQMQRHGFSLVELSIVLVILGLLTGGILGGKSLIKAAELRAVGQEYENWQIAVKTFENKYAAIPGDMSNAEDFWGRSGVGDGKTWNGNGNGNINQAPSANTHGEMFTFWQHLSLAGLIPGTYTGVAGPGSNEDAEIGENVPPSKFSRGGWTVNHSDEVWLPDDFDLDYGNTYQVGAAPSTWETAEPLFTPEEAWNIDTKFDDGKPGQGIVIANYWNNLCSNASSNTDFNAEYRLEDPTVLCALFFRKAF